MKKKNILIPDADERLTRLVVFCLSQARDYNIFLLSDNRNHHMRYSKNCEKFYMTDVPGYTQSRIENILSITEKDNIDLLFPISVPGYRLMLKNLNILRKITKTTLAPYKSNYEIAANKKALAYFCEKNKINTPKTLPIQDLSIIDDLEGFQFPVLLKPSEGKSGIGILRFNEKQAASKYICDNIKAINDKYIVQEYIDAKEVDINVLCENGRILTHTIQKGIIPPNREFSFSKGIELIKSKEVLAFVRPLFEKLNWSGIAHVDLLYDKGNNRIYILEINPRMWGTILGSSKGGINFPDLLIKKSLDVNFDNFPQDYKLVKYATIGKQVLRKIYSRSSPLNLSDTNLKWILMDPLPTIMATYNKLRNKVSKKLPFLGLFIDFEYKF